MESMPYRRTKLRKTGRTGRSLFCLEEQASAVGLETLPLQILTGIYTHLYRGELAVRKASFPMSGTRSIPLTSREGPEIYLHSVPDLLKFLRTCASSNELWHTYSTGDVKKTIFRSIRNNFV